MIHPRIRAAHHGVETLNLHVNPVNERFNQVASISKMVIRPVFCDSKMVIYLIDAV